jgi:hypothetical protein
MHPMSGMWGARGLGDDGDDAGALGCRDTGIVLAIRWIARPGGRSRSDRALDILRERYARGEARTNSKESSAIFAEADSNAS